jgi:DNA-binding MarR family transcriptional regulator
MRKISGHELRDRLISRQRSTVSQPTEAMRIEALSSSGNRELLQIIATRQPRSIGELAVLANRLQPNVSRSINALALAGLLTVKFEGRATIPSLTVEGKRKAEDLGFIEQSTASAEPTEVSPPLRAHESVILATIPTEEADKDSDVVEADIAVRLRADRKSAPSVAHGRVDLNEVCYNLLANWWRVLCRRADPYKMFPLQKETENGMSHAVLLARATGRLELFVRSALEEKEVWDLPRHQLTVDEFTNVVSNDLVRPLVSHLRAHKRFDRPVESMLHRTEEILRQPKDFEFWKTAGALGLTYQNMTNISAENVIAFIKAIEDEGARLDFASSIDSDQTLQSLDWALNEVAKKAQRNSLPRLITLRQRNSVDLAGMEPWRIGKEHAREARAQIGLAPDSAVGGLVGLSRILGDDDKFTPSSAGEEVLRGFQGFSNNLPVIVVRDEGPRNTAFLMARGIGDYLVYGSHEAPIANIYSDRQAVGRAFAAEFLAPSSGVVHMIDNEQASVATVANHYGVIRDVVTHQYENSVAQYAQ